MSFKKKILVVGGGGYVGSVLVPKLLQENYFVRVYDTFWYGEQVFGSLRNNPDLQILKGDIRSMRDNSIALSGMDVVLDLACISNDPSADLNPKFTYAINYGGQLLLMKMAKEAKIEKFIYASSSSVYGVRKEKNVTEDLSPEPITQYSKLKSETEKILLGLNSENFTAVILRPATVCGYSPRMRLDLTVNLLTSQAISNKKITVFGGTQKRPNINIHDMADAYLLLVEADKNHISGEIFNVGYGNHRIIEIAKMVKRIIGKAEIVLSETNDLRSYHISSEKIKKKLGYTPRHTIKDAIIEIKNAFECGLIKDSSNEAYYNVRFMKSRHIDTRGVYY